MFEKYWNELDKEELFKVHYNKLNNILNNYYKQKYNRVMIELSYCPYYYENNKDYKHHYHQGYSYLESLEDTISLYD